MSLLLTKRQAKELDICYTQEEFYKKLKESSKDKVIFDEAIIESRIGMGILGDRVSEVFEQVIKQSKPHQKKTIPKGRRIK